MKIYSNINDMTWEFEQVEKNGLTILKENGKKLTFDFTDLGNNRFLFIINNTSHLVHIIKENGIFHVHLEGDYFAVRVEDERTRELRSLVEQGAQTSGEQTLVAPIPGLITKIRVNEGEAIEQGQGLFILEAMKMENEIKADYSGSVKKILVNEGSPVEKDQELVVIEQ